VEGSREGISKGTLEGPIETVTAWRIPRATRSQRCIGLWTQSWCPHCHPSSPKSYCLALGPS
jgi:hypothetical protein